LILGSQIDHNPRSKHILSYHRTRTDDFKASYIGWN